MEAAMEVPRMPTSRSLVLAALCALAAPALASDPGAEAGRAYALDTTASTASVEAGRAGKLVVVIRPTAPGWHVHPQAPLKVRFEAPPALKVQKPELGRGDAIDAQAGAPRFETPFVAAARGAVEAKARVDFFICSDQACVKQTRTVPIPVDVK
jgi:hypothetical protein